MYCWNNPVNAHDPSGHFGLFMTLLFKAAVGGIINLATSYLAAKVTGQEYTLTDALVAFGTGALCSFGGAGVAIGGVLSGVHSYNNAHENGLSVGKSVICGVVSFGSTVCCMGNVTPGRGIGKTAFVNAVYSTANNTISSAANIGIIESDKFEKKQDAENIDQKKSNIELQKKNTKNKKSISIKDLRKMRIGDYIGDPYISNMVEIKSENKEKNIQKRIKEDRKRMIQDRINNYNLDKIIS